MRELLDRPSARQPGGKAALTLLIRSKAKEHPLITKGNLMKLASALTLLFIATLPAFGQQTAAADVQAAYERYRKAAEAEDLAGIQAAFAPDANTRIFFTDGTGLVGVPAIVEGYRRWFATCDQIRLSPKNVAVQVSSAGDVAWLTYLEDGSAVSKGRTDTWKDTRATIVFHKVTQRWLITHAHWSDAPPQPAEGASTAPSLLAQQVSTSTKQEIQIIQDAWAQAYLKKDVGILERILGAEFYIFSAWDGKRYSRADEIQSLPIDPIAYTSVANLVREVQVHGDIAIALGQFMGTGTEGGKPVDQRGTWQTVFAKRNGQWVAIASHAAPEPQK